MKAVGLAARRPADVDLEVVEAADDATPIDEVARLGDVDDSERFN